MQNTRKPHKVLLRRLSGGSTNQKAIKIITAHKSHLKNIFKGLFFICFLLSLFFAAVKAAAVTASAAEILSRLFPPYNEYYGGGKTDSYYKNQDIIVKSHNVT